MTSHPWDLSDRLIAAMAECPSVCEHLHLPVQSGDDAVLRRMGRQYTVEPYRERVERLRAAVPGISLTTDVIVGLLRRDRGAVRGARSILEEVRFDQVFAAAFSPRPGTPATRLADDVPADEKRRRLNELLALQEGIGHERNQAWLGRDVEVLVDTITPARTHAHDADEGAGAAASRQADGVGLSGRTRGNKLVHFTGEPILLGREVTVHIAHAGPYALRGAVVTQEQRTVR